MKPFRPVYADDPTSLIPIEVRVGGEFRTVNLPRFDMIDEATLKGFQSDIEAIDPELAPVEQQKAQIMVQMRSYLDDDERAAMESEPIGVLAQYMTFWTEQSALPLGKSSPSVESSTESTARRSARTSSARDGDG